MIDIHLRIALSCNYYFISILISFLAITARMEKRGPRRSVRVRDAELGKGVFRGSWAEMLQQLIYFLGIKTKVIVKVMSFYDGSILALYRVALKLPPELKMGFKMPFGEAKNVEVAFQIAAVRAVTEIRTSKSYALVETPFNAIPSANYRLEGPVDYKAFLKTNPRDVAEFMDSCLKMIRAYHKTFGVVAGEVEAMIEQYSSPEVIQEKCDILRYEAEKGYTDPPPTPARYVEEVEPDTPIYPDYTPPHSGYVLVEEEKEWQNWEPEVPSATGWDEEPYQGTQSDPIRIPGDPGEPEVTSHTPRRKPRVGESSKPIKIDSEEEDEEWKYAYETKYYPKTEKGDESRGYFNNFEAVPTGYDDGGEGYGDEDVYDGEAAAYKYLDSYFAMTDMTLEASPSDPEYQPTINVKLPGILRRTRRNCHWKPGKYAEK